MTVPPSTAQDATTWLERTFDAHWPEVHRYIARRLSSDVADDLAAEVFLVAVRGGYDPSRGEIRPWLYGIATNLVAKHRRAEVRRWKALGRTAEPRAESHEETTLARVAAGALTGRLAGALAGLKRGDRDVVLLIALAGLTHAEVAEALGIPYGTVASRLNRARKQLRKTLGDLEDHDG